MLENQDVENSEGLGGRGEVKGGGRRGRKLIVSILLTESYNCCSLATTIGTGRVGDGNQVRREILKTCIGRRSCKLHGSFSVALLQGMQRGWG